MRVARGADRERLFLGRDDQVVDWEAAAAFFKATSSKEKRLIFMPDAGHAIPVDYGWERVTRRAVAWMEQRSG